MAEGLARTRFGDRVRVQSAGSRPSSVNPLAVKAMAELEIDITEQTSKSVDIVDRTTVDVVVTLCAEEVCPSFLGFAGQLHWALPDPAVATGSEEERLQAFRKVRDEIARRLVDLELGAGIEGGA